MPLLVRVFFPSSAGETSEKEQEDAHPTFSRKREKA
jgi:hypothetical protein